MDRKLTQCVYTIRHCNVSSIHCHSAVFYRRVFFYIALGVGLILLSDLWQLRNWYTVAISISPDV